MKSKIAAWICAVILLIGLSACADTSAPIQSIKTPSKVNGFAVKTEKDILADLDANGIYTFWDSYCVDDYGKFQGSDYTLDSLEITRKKVDKDAATDDIYVTLSAQNMSCSYIGSFHLLYSLYDVGGWYLEDVELESGELEPLHPVSEDAARDLVLELLRILGADASDVEIFNEFHPTPMEESLVFKLDFNDGVLAVSGNITLTFEHDGRNWNYSSYEPNLYYDILLDGTYQNRRDLSCTTYLTFTHRNGSLEVWMADSWSEGIDPFYQKDWPFDPFTRSFETDGGHYFFDYDGLIYSEAIDSWWGAFTRIAAPITDVSVLEAYLTQTGIPRDKIHYEQSQIVSANFIPSTRPGEFPQLAPLPLPDQSAASPQTSTLIQSAATEDSPLAAYGPMTAPTRTWKNLSPLCILHPMIPTTIQKRISRLW